MPWTAIIWFGILLIVCYAPVISHLIWQWAHDDDMGHGFFVPVVSAYLIWQRRAELSVVKPTPNYWGLVLVILGAVQMMLGTLSAQIFIARVAFMVSLIGAIWFLGGTRTLKVLAFPLFLLIFMIPIPAIIYAKLTLPLQLFASSVAETVLSFVGIPVLRDGNVLELASEKLSVVEACSGIRSLLTLSYLALVYGYFFDGKVWMRWVLLIATVPIAIVANATRVTLTGMISEWRPALAHGFFHTVEGWVLFLVAGLMLMLFHQFINRAYLAYHSRNDKVDADV